ncbi:hypothetical protein M413DRAFT_248210 [Hebeloma cylindrosporum]|uniref:Uncharacterized protein n=1 Tax=Hebeloma cylindrosporum TaxID=76867 RepID=A0A0C2YB39_HEBCY|nr:hypothetical protein M413DRAFT_248210 [Hebeloma cylindrosporum h7]
MNKRSFTSFTSLEGLLDQEDDRQGTLDDEVHGEIIQGSYKLRTQILTFVKSLPGKTIVLEMRTRRSSFRSSQFTFCQWNAQERSPAKIIGALPVAVRPIIEAARKRKTMGKRKKSMFRLGGLSHFRRLHDKCWGRARRRREGTYDFCGFRCE